jgi:hypothetical protein
MGCIFQRSGLLCVTYGQSRIVILSSANFVAEEFVGTVCSAIDAAGGLEAPPATYNYFPKAFEPEWIKAHPLPLGDSKVITLVRGSEFDRLAPAKAAAAYDRLPRTKIYGEFNTGWLALAGQYLMTFAECQVVFTAYESLPDDETMGAHTDDVPVLAIQWWGEKAWWLGHQACEEGGDPTLTLKPGGALFLPKGYPHNVRTLATLHLSIGAALDKPIFSQV